MASLPVDRVMQFFQDYEQKQTDLSDKLQRINTAIATIERKENELAQTKAKLKRAFETHSNERAGLQAKFYKDMSEASEVSIKPFHHHCHRFSG